MSHRDAKKDICPNETKVRTEVATECDCHEIPESSSIAGMVELPLTRKTADDEFFYEKNVMRERSW
jgi:hypothetical protein